MYLLDINKPILNVYFPQRNFASLKNIL